MRMRKKKNFENRILACSHYLVENPQKYKGNYYRIFQNQNPIHLEIGCGRGKFLTELAKLNPNINYIGIEKLSNVILLALEKANALNLQNIRFISQNANILDTMFEKDEIDTIYLNFSDPWPKSSYAKNRLTHRRFLVLYQSILKEDGHLFLKTDNSDLFDFSLRELSENGFEILNMTHDLHSSEIEGNIMTEYETKFHEMGVPIHFLDAVLKKEQPESKCRPRGKIVEHNL